jgi:hypothetical protein
MCQQENISDIIFLDSADLKDVVNPWVDLNVEWDSNPWRLVPIQEQGF